MNENNLQKLYDQAYGYWQNKKIDQALESIEKVLNSMPEDLDVHALAMHIKDEKHDLPGFVYHAEYILDHDVNYKDRLDKNNDQDGYKNHLMLAYPLLKKVNDDEIVDAFPGQAMVIKKRFYKYAMKIIKAGYGIPNPESLLSTMIKLEHYDDLIDIAFFTIGEKNAEEIGLPGLDNCEDLKACLEDTCNDEIMDAFFHTGQDELALNWLLKRHKMNPDDWFNHVLLGEVYSRLDQPEETARQWMISLQKGGSVDSLFIPFGDLCNMVADNKMVLKEILFSRLHAFEKSIPAEKKAIFKRISIKVCNSAGKPGLDLLTDSYIENTLDIKLPPIEEGHYRFLHRVWLPGMFGAYPYLKKSKNNQEKIDKLIIPDRMQIKPETIERYGIDLTLKAKDGKLPPIVGRDKEIESLIHILLRMEKNNPILIGEAGVGKTAVVHGLAQFIAEGKIPGYLKGKRIIELPMSSLVSGTIYRGDFETRMTRVIKEARENKDIILFIDELHTMIGAGSSGDSNLDAANIVKPALARGELRLIGSTTLAEYEQYIEKDQAMARRFTPVRVPEMNAGAALEVLKMRGKHWSEKDNIIIPDRVLSQTVALCEFQLSHRKFPDKAIDLLDEACAYLRTKNESSSVQLELTMEVVQIVLSEWLGATIDNKFDDKNVRTSIISHVQKASLLLKEKVIAQENAINIISNLIIQSQLVLKDRMIPLSILLYGPKGTGKTTSINTIANILWPGKTDKIMIINMNDYQDAVSINRLIGSFYGYAGYEINGLLSTRLKRQPYSIIVLKNIYKANKYLIDFFTDLLRCGFYMESNGQKIIAGDTIFIIHVDKEEGAHTLGYTDHLKSNDNNGKMVLQYLEKEGISKEFIYSINYLASYDPLKQEAVNKILTQKFEEIRYEWNKKNIHIDFEESFITLITKEFLDLPGDKRNIEYFIHNRITSKIRERLINKKENDNKIIFE